MGPFHSRHFDLSKTESTLFILDNCRLSEIQFNFHLLCALADLREYFHCDWSGIASLKKSPPFRFFFFFPFSTSHIFM